jgi:hypothetical protein
MAKCFSPYRAIVLFGISFVLVLMRGRFFGALHGHILGLSVVLNTVC